MFGRLRAIVDKVVLRVDFSAEGAEITCHNRWLQHLPFCFIIIICVMYGYIRVYHVFQI